MPPTYINPELITTDCPELVLGEQLRFGGQRQVWKCAYDDRAYVLKALAASEPTRRRLMREITLMRACDSPYLPKFGPLTVKELQAGNAEPFFYYLEEYIPGVPLGSVAKPMTQQEVVALGSCITQALAALAAIRYVHRDVKPMNIIQRSEADYVLIDAGYALAADDELLTQPGQTVGTKPYLSRDQLILPAKDLDVRSDMFALGITLYEFVTGVHPFLNDEMPRGDVLDAIRYATPVTPQYFSPELSDDLTQLIMRLLEKDRSNRYESAAELLTALTICGTAVQAQ